MQNTIERERERTNNKKPKLLDVEERGPCVISSFSLFFLWSPSSQLHNTSSLLETPKAQIFFVFAASGSLMASWVLSECGLKPLPRVYPQARKGLTSKTAIFANARPLSVCKSKNLGSSLRVSNGIRGTNWALNVSAPLRVPSVDGGDNGRVSVKGVEDGSDFDHGAPPPFNLSDIRAAIPKHLWVKDPWRSMSYVVRDVAVVLGLAAVAAYFNNWVVWPLYWFAQGTMFWALFVLGHDW